jgi:hypothetical protein
MLLQLYVSSMIFVLHELNTSVSHLDKNHFQNALALYTCIFMFQMLKLKSENTVYILTFKISSCIIQVMIFKFEIEIC